MTYSEFPSAHLLTLLKLLLGFSGKQGLKEARLNKEIFKLAMVGGILFFFYLSYEAPNFGFHVSY